MRGSHFAVACAALLIATGCATDPISTFAAKPVAMESRLLYLYESANTVPMTIVRDEGFMVSACAARVLVNDQVAAYVRAGEKVTLHMPPGEYVIGADTRTGGLCQIGRVEIEANVQSGRPRAYRIGFSHNGEIGLYRTVAR